MSNKKITEKVNKSICMIVDMVCCSWDSYVHGLPSVHFVRTKIMLPGSVLRRSFNPMIAHHAAGKMRNVLSLSYPLCVNTVI